METNLSEIFAEIKALKNSMATKEDLATMVSKVDSLENSMTSLENSISALGSNMASKADLASVSEEVSIFKGRLDDVVRTIAEDRSILNVVEADVSGIRLEMAELKGNADKADSNLEGFGQRLHETENRVQALEQSDQQLVAKVVEHLSPNLDGTLQTIVDQQMQNTVH